MSARGHEPPRERAGVSRVRLPHRDGHHQLRLLQSCSLIQWKLYFYDCCLVGPSNPSLIHLDYSSLGPVLVTSVKSMMPPGLPAVRYADHLSQEHRILFEQVGSVQTSKYTH